jgi:serine/threonine protein phosphatase PrpC
VRSLKIVGKSDVGKIRPTNEDKFATGELPGGAIFTIVCDGMGGANGGNIASDTAVKIISNHIVSGYRQDMNGNSIKRMLQSAAFAANVTIFDMAKSVESLKGMGTTLVVALINGDTAYIAHAGDSRAYLITDGFKMSQITRDHSVVQHMLEIGELTTEEALHHPRRNVITRALGVGETVEVEYNEIDFSADDLILICTDGLTNYVDNEGILDILSGYEFSEYANELIEGANQNGGGDNITVVVMKK